MEDLLDIVRNARRILCLCGAGISTPSGIEDFKTMYTKNPLLKQSLSKDSWKRHKKLLIQFLFSFYENSANPTEIHYWIAALEKNGRLQRCYTMNIDGLESKAGVTRLAEVHGSLRNGGRCGKHRLSGDMLKKVTLNNTQLMNIEAEGKCDIRPNIVMYGETVKEMEHINDDIMRSDLILCIGTRLNVSPISDIVKEAAMRGKRIIIVNREYLPNFPYSAQLQIDVNEFVRKIKS